MDIGTQIIRWGIASNLFLIILSLIMLVTCFMLGKREIKNMENRSGFGNCNEIWAWVILFSIVTGIVFSIILGVSLFGLAKVLIVPDIFLQEYLKTVGL